MNVIDRRVSLTLAVLFTSAGAASADSVLFGFEEYAGVSGAPGTYSTLVYSKGGVTLEFTRMFGPANPSGTRFDIENLSPFNRPATWGNKALSPFFNASQNDWFVASITAAPGAVTSIRMEYGDYGGDTGNARLVVLDGLYGTGAQLSSQSQAWNGNFNLGSAPGFFTYSGTGIQSFAFRGEEGVSGFPNSLYWDNFLIEFDSTIIPLPSAGLLAGAGLLVIPLSRRRGSIR